MGKTRVSARVGREGEMDDHFEQLDYYEIGVDIRTSSSSSPAKKGSQGRDEFDRA